MRKNELNVGDEYVLRVRISPGTKEWREASWEEHHKRQRFVDAKVVSIPMDGRGVEVTYMSWIRDNASNMWRQGNVTKTADSRSIIRRSAEQRAIDAEKAEAARIARNTALFEEEQRAAANYEVSIIIEQTVALLAELGIIAQPLNLVWTNTYGRIPISIRLDKKEVIALRDYILSRTINT